ncbi:hypothetical protein [Microbacterium kunmingense]|uniref:hypothetical protein n=1 Tax=Microbacterium kunmingense TaxID=2915939 RepID=UPI003D747058
MSAEHAPIIPMRPTPNLADLVAQRSSLKADAEYIQDQIAALDSRIIDGLNGQVGVHDVDGTKVEIREYSRTDYKRVEAEHPVEEYPQLYVTALDTDAVKSQFSPAALEHYKVRGKKSVVIR